MSVRRFRQLGSDQINKNETSRNSERCPRYRKYDTLLIFMYYLIQDTSSAPN